MLFVVRDCLGIAINNLHQLCGKRLSHFHTFHRKLWYQKQINVISVKRGKRFTKEDFRAVLWTKNCQFFAWMGLEGWNMEGRLPSWSILHAKFMFQFTKTGAQMGKRSEAGFHAAAHNGPWPADQNTQHSSFLSYFSRTLSTSSVYKRMQYANQRGAGSCRLDKSACRLGLPGGGPNLLQKFPAFFSFISWEK